MILDDILRAKREELSHVEAQIPLHALVERRLYGAPRRAFRETLEAVPRAIIAEVKKASPSRGVIREDFDPIGIASRYAACGAAAISVLTERRFFMGRLESLEEIRGHVPCPLLRKDFLFDPYQIHEARAYGADAVLLIVAALDDGRLRDLHALARELEMEALVEVHDRCELDRAVAAGASLIGINNRDLRTFATTLTTTESLAPQAPPGGLIVAESGIESPGDIVRLERCGVHAFLIGEALMRADDPGIALRQLLAADAG